MDERRPRFRELQATFAAHLRDPARNEPPKEVDERGLKVYRELFFNNMESFIGSGFPVLKSLFSDQDWRQLIRDFFSEHAAKTPLFIEIAREFVDYLEFERKPRPWDPPFLFALAHYEWVELALQVAPFAPPPIDPHFAEDLFSAPLVFSKVAFSLAYDYPVQQIGPHFRPEGPLDQAQQLLVFRDRFEQVRFVELSPFAYELIAKIEDGAGVPVGRLLPDIASRLPGLPIDQVTTLGLEFVQNLHEKGVVGKLSPQAADL